jgi:hypothetical protein
MQNNSRRLQKTPVLVEIILADGSTLHGKIFVSPQDRLIDALNDERAFLPVETIEGTVLAVAKTAIKHVVLPTIYPAAYRGNDPYLILGVKEGVSNEKIKQAYHQLCMNSHPDRIKGFGLGPDFQELASQNMVRINNAYMQIVRSRKNHEGKVSDVAREVDR